MRIAMLGWELPPFVSGGLGVHCYHLTKALAEKGIEIDFYMPRAEGVKAPWMNLVFVDDSALKESTPSEWGPYYRLMKEASKNEEKNGVPYDLNFFEAVNRYNFLCARIVERSNKKRHYDLIHCHDWISTKAGIDSKKRTGRPLVLTMHSTEYDRTANLWPFEWILNIERDGVREADRIIAVSKMMKNQLVVRFGANEGKIRVVYNAAQLDQFRTQAKKEQFGINSPVVLFHGRLSIQKGPEFFLQAAKKVLEKIPDARFIVSGKGDMLPRLVEMSIELGIQDRVTFTGYIPAEKLPLIYAISDVYVLPSVSEPFGITVLEAMASGTPCVISRTAGVGEVLNHCLKVDFWDVNEMANKIIALLRYAALRDTIRKGLSEDLMSFSWEKAADETKGVYEECLRG
ncbi:glycosyltransferase family 4 protein [Candidatus Micrarchaeota archaeon]|nr:glycosyltransferase family 4 protein [Candidatus Micrarchaeota archaeon]